MTLTCRQALRTASDMLAKASVPDATVDAAFLLSHITGLDHLLLRVEGDRQLTDSQYAGFLSLVERRCRREPLQYILGTAVFMGLTLRSAAGALIPRNDTEALCEQAVARLKGNERVLDLCTGTGALALAIAHKFPSCRVSAGDISPDALRIARENAVSLSLTVDMRQGDLLAPFEHETFDMIVSNPPYVTREEMENLQPEVLFEPSLALFGGEDGLDFYRRIIAESPRFLSSRGWLLLEIGTCQAASVTALLQKDFEDISLYQDMQGLDRVLCGRLNR